MLEFLRSILGIAARDEGVRSVNISAALAGRCEVGHELLELNNTNDQDTQSNAQGAQAIDATASGNDLAAHIVVVTVPCVPGRVPTRGIAILDKWAMQAAAADAQGHPAADWLPDFLIQNSSGLPAAVRAADFLGCRTFLELMLEVQLLRVVLLGSEKLKEAASAPAASPSSWKLRDALLMADYLRLPSVNESDIGGGGGDAAGAGQSGAGDGPGEAPEGLTFLTPAEVEALVGSLESSRLLTGLGASRWDIRRCLFRLGVRPVLAASCNSNLEVAASCNLEERVTKRTRSYVQLFLPPPPPLPPAPAGSGAEARYEVEAVTVVAESHDQGWSSYPEDGNTYDNSWTWAELQLLRADGSPAWPDGADGGAQLGRVYTNLHAVSRWQEHFRCLGPDNPLVRELNEVVFGGPQAAAAAAGGFRLDLLVIAEFPGWVHHVRRGELAVHWRVVGCGGGGRREVGGAGEGAVAVAAEGSAWEEKARRRHRLLFSRKAAS